jgi:hypothetical protein
MKKLMGIFTMVLLTAIIGSAYAQKPEVAISNKSGWHKIGEVTASYKSESDAIAVLGADKYKAIKLKVTDAPINIKNATIEYESGETQNLPINFDLLMGKETKVFNLTRPDDGIKKITFDYKTPSNTKKDKAHVELYGLK